VFLRILHCVKFKFKRQTQIQIDINIETATETETETDIALTRLYLLKEYPARRYLIVTATATATDIATETDIATIKSPYCPSSSKAYDRHKFDKETRAPQFLSCVF